MKNNLDLTEYERKNEDAILTALDVLRRSRREKKFGALYDAADFLLDVIETGGGVKQSDFYEAIVQEIEDSIFAMFPCISKAKLQEKIARMYCTVD